ncbi:MAG TPA: hypothetical protein DCY13_11105 [Verrucomicrobiales bacterium]|nr:hypothetical protein [Verrucomicrobiales bacterium]
MSNGSAMVSGQLDAVGATRRVESRHISAASWHARVIIVGAVCIVIGILWDISWHRTIGRDSFWTPAHLAIYLGGVLGGCVGGWLILRGTFIAAVEEQAQMVCILGLRGPFGAWLCVWGAIAMLTSAPFDDWWHNAYGLDVKILSPPHTVLAFGMWAIVWGALFLVLREQNVARGPEGGAAAAGQALPGRWLVVFAGGILIAMAATFLTEESWPNQQRNMRFYQASMMVYPLYLVALARASAFRFGGTMVAGAYMLIYCLQGWLLPLFHGEPKLGPVYNPIGHFAPLTFPLLLVVPALAVDLLLWLRGGQRGWWRDWLLAAALAAAFFGLFFVTQWYFSGVLISETAHNRFFFGELSWGYSDQQGEYRGRFWSEINPQWNAPATWSGIWWALLWAFGAVRLGLWFGTWLASVKR